MQPVDKRAHRPTRKRLWVFYILTRNKLFSTWTHPLRASMVSVIGVLLCGAAGVTFMSRVDPHDAVVTLTCESMEIPQQFMIDLRGIKSVHLRGYKGTIQRNQKAYIVSSAGIRESSNSVLLLEPTKPDSSLLLSPLSKFGLMSVIMADGTRLWGGKVNVNASANFTVTSSRLSDVLLNLQAEKLGVTEANRFRLFAPPNKASLIADEDFRLTSSNQLSLVNGTFISVQPMSSLSKVDATFNLRQKVSEYAIVSAARPLSSLKPNILKFYNCAVVNVAIDGKDLLDTGKGRGLNVNLRSAEFTITSVTLQKHELANNYFLNIQYRGLATSIEQGKHELMPTRLAEILDKKPAEKGLYGLAGLFLIFVGTIVLKRSLEVIANFFLPDAKTDTKV